MKPWNGSLRSRAEERRARDLLSVSACESVDLFAEMKVSLYQGFNISTLNVRRFHPGPLRARQQSILGPRRQLRVWKVPPGINSYGRSPALRSQPR